jgi:hypothetical protein
MFVCTRRTVGYATMNEATTNSLYQNQGAKSEHMLQ